jgi:hypothetical protein
VNKLNAQFYCALLRKFAKTKEQNIEVSYLEASANEKNIEKSNWYWDLSLKTHTHDEHWCAASEFAKRFANFMNFN